MEKNLRLMIEKDVIDPFLRCDFVEAQWWARRLELHHKRDELPDCVKAIAAMTTTTPDVGDFTTILPLIGDFLDL